MEITFYFLCFAVIPAYAAWMIAAVNHATADCRRPAICPAAPPYNVHAAETLADPLAPSDTR